MATDMLTLREAAARCGRSVSTLRSWMRDGTLQTRHDTTRKNAPVLVALDALTAAMQAHGVIERTGLPVTAYQLGNAHVGQAQDSDIVAELRARVAQLTSDIEWYRAQLAQAQDTAKHLQAQLHDEHDRVLSLQRELISTGSHGLGIKAAFKSLFG